MQVALIDIKRLERNIELNALNEIREECATADNPEWSLICHAINTSLLSIIEHIDNIILDSNDIDKQKESVTELYRNVYLAKHLLQSPSIEEDQRSDFQEKLSMLTATISDSLGESEVGEQYLRDLNTAMRESKERSNSYEFHASDLIYGESIEPSEKNETITLGEDALWDDMKDLLMTLVQSYTFFKDIETPKIMEIIGQLKSEQAFLDSNLFWVEFMENDNFSFKAFEEDGALTLSVNPKDEAIEIVDSDCKEITEKSGLFGISEDLAKILGSFIGSNSMLRTQIDSYNATKNINEGQFYYSYALKSPTEE